MSNNDNVNLIPCADVSDLMTRAAGFATSAGCVVLPGTLYHQNGRACFACALPMTALSQISETNRPGKNAELEDVEGAENRGLDPTHKKNITNYVQGALASNEDYIIPALTLNMRHRVDVLHVDNSAPVQAAFMIMPMGVPLSITDGQHRAAGLAPLSKELAKDGVAAMITFTSDIHQMHQDFADCGKTKPINAAVLAVFDQRNPANKMVIELVKTVPLFENTVDSVKASISAGSVKVWTLNQIRLFLKWTLVQKQCSDAVFVSNSIETLGDPQDYAEFITKVRVALQILAEHNPVARRLASLSKSELKEVPKIRATTPSLLMTASGLAALGYALHECMPLKDDLFAQRIQQIAKYDWSQASPLFANNLKIDRDRTQTGQKYIACAGESLLAGRPVQCGGADA